MLVDRNNGQLDIASRMVFPMPDLEAVFESFGWQVTSVDATQYDGVYAALEQFRTGRGTANPGPSSATRPRDTALCSDFLNRHKVVVTDA